MKIVYTEITAIRYDPALASPEAMSSIRYHHNEESPMQLKRRCLLILLGLIGFTWSPIVQSVAAAETVVESARDIPVSYDVDVVVVGGTTGAVSAAIEAAGEGASVFLAAPRPYLGEDVCGTLRLWLRPDEEPQSELEHKLFEMPDAPRQFPGRVKFTYEADQPANSKHSDTSPPSRLTDGLWQSAANQSVQYDRDVTIIADLGRNVRVKEMHLLVYQRGEEFAVADVAVWTSPNGTLWRELGTVKNTKLSIGSAEETPIDLTMSIKQPSRFVKVLVRKTESAERILLGELVIVEDQADQPIVQKKDAPRQPPTPMHVKYALDQALLDAGVKFLYGSAITDVLVDQDGQPAGIVMANRSGRQAVRAKVVIDGTARATAARLAGAEFKPYPSGLHRFERIVVGGEPHPGKDIEVHKADVQFVSKDGMHDVFIYTLKLPMKDAGYASFANAEQLARDRTFDVSLVDESDVLFQVPPDAMISGSPTSGDEFASESIDLRALQPADINNLYVLGGCADVSRAVAEKLLRPLAQIRLGQRVGKAAAELAQSRKSPDEVRVAGPASGEAEDVGEVREFLNGVRPTHQASETVPSSLRGLPVLGEYDVVIVGGGTGGAPAGIGAARRHAKTLVVEFQDHLGGVGTLGLISSYYYGYRAGFTAEVDRGVQEMGGPQRRGGWNPVSKREWWRREIRKAGGDIWFSTLGCGTVVRDYYVVGVVVTTPLGRGVVLAKTVVDSTGNSDVAAAAGADTVTTSAEHIAMQGTGLPPRALGTGYTNTDYSFVDESDPVDQWRMIVTSREKYKNSYDMSPFIDTRERRRIVGDFVISPLDIMNGRTYDDSIAIHSSNFDTHGYTVHPVFLIDFPDKATMHAFVPYRALLPKGLDGLLVTGLGISAHRDAMPILRMQACIQNQGYAAGVAASMAAAEGTSVRSINIKELQHHLVEVGSLTPDVLKSKDSYPLPPERVEAAVKSVVHDYRGLAVILAQSDVARPLLRDAYSSATDPADKLIYANILGMIGDTAGVETLIAAIDSQSWDKGWNFRGMGQFGGSISRLDSLIIALGRTGDERGVPAILRKLQELDASQDFSHHRAVAMALESLHVSSAAKPLAELLEKDGMTGYALTQIDADVKSAGSEHRSQPLREIILARALFRCGDHNGVGEGILRTYEKDLRGLFARHAHAVLNAKK